MESEHQCFSCRQYFGSFRSLSQHVRRYCSATSDATPSLINNDRVGNGHNSSNGPNNHPSNLPLANHNSVVAQRTSTEQLRQPENDRVNDKHAQDNDDFPLHFDDDQEEEDRSCPEEGGVWEQQEEEEPCNSHHNNDHDDARYDEEQTTSNGTQPC